jgi:hypothetical protein
LAGLDKQKVLSTPQHTSTINLQSSFLMSIRPLNTLTLDEVIQLLNTPAFYECFEFAYDMYHFRQRLVQFTHMEDYAMLDDPPVPVITPRNDHPIDG